MSVITFESMPAASRTARRNPPFHGAANWIRRQYVIRRTRHILHKLPDSVLTDIGIERWQIDAIVTERVDEAGNQQGPYPF